MRGHGEERQQVSAPGGVHGRREVRNLALGEEYHRAGGEQNPAEGTSSSLGEYEGSC